MEHLVENISDTARWVAIFRADESERPDAVFNDPFARKLAGEQGEQIANAIEFSKQHRWSFIARTFLFDEIITQHVAKGFDMVINLAAGLDTRPYRMNLPATLKWVEVDLPGILEYKEKILDGAKPVCKLESIKLDLSDKDKRIELFRRLNKEAEKILVITEGLIIYLEAHEAGELADDLSSQNHFQRWAFDMSSPAILQMIKKEMEPTLREANVTFKFAPEEGEDFFYAHGWKSVESFSKFKTAAKLNRLPQDMVQFADMPEPPGPRRDFPWSGVCLFENMR